MSFAEKIVRIDSRYIWLLLIAMYAIPVVHPLAIPVRITEQTKILYNRIEQLKPGRVVLVEMSAQLRYMPEIEAGATAIIKHIFAKKAKIVFFSVDVEGPPFLRIVMGNINPEETFGVKYGEDYVFLGYIAGTETAEVGMMTDIWTTAPADYYNNKLGDLPMMKNVHNVNDADFLISFYTGLPDDRVRSYSVKGGLKDDRAWGAFTSGANVPNIAPYLQSKQMLDALGGAVGGTEYEAISGYRGKGLTNSDIISMTHMYMLALIVVANVGYLGSRLMKQGARGPGRK